MADRTGISLLGFAGYKDSERFLHALEDEIWLSRDPAKIPVHRPEDITSDDAMRTELALCSPVTVISAHAGPAGGPFFFCGTDDQPPLAVGSIRSLGASSMLIIDTCHASEIAAKLKPVAQHGSLIAFLRRRPGKDEQIAWGRDSVSATAAIIRELCYPYPRKPDLSPAAAARAVDRVNAQVQARNDAERRRGVTNEDAMVPLIDILEC